MKKYICTALALLMAATLFVGCGCTNRNVSDHPGGKITDPTSATNPMPTMTEPTTATTRPTTEPTRETTMPTTGATDGTDGTGGMDGTGIMPDTSEMMPGATGSGAPSDATDNARSSHRWPDRKS